jgi:hypothetical protein
MDIYDNWKLYKQKMEEHILRFNEANKQSNFDEMKRCKESTKAVYLKFIELLKL